MSTGAGGAGEYTAILREALARYPELPPFLGRLCDVWDRQGAPPARLSLGSGLSRHGELAALHALFGAAVEVSRSGRAFLRVRAFLARFDAPGAEAWADALYAAMGRARRDRAAERRQAGQSFDELLAAWRLAFPTVVAAAPVIEGQAEKWKRRLQTGVAEGVRAQWWSWGQALTFLAPRPEALGLAELGAQVYGSSKALRRGEARSLLVSGLAALEDIDEDQVEPGDILRLCGLCDNPTALKVTVCGPLRLRKHGRWLDWIEQLHALGESATLSLANLDGVDIIGSAAAGALVHTCENETPFCRLVREGCPGTLVYTEGYPNRAVRRLLQLLPSGTTIRHWGDSDLDGLRIAAILAQDRPLHLWRCGLVDLERQREFLIPLSVDASRRARHWLQTHPEFRFRDELAFTLAHGWLEQESWRGGE